MSSSPALATAGYRLLQPLRLTGGQLTLRNRVIMAPLTRGRAGPSRVPTELMAAYYAQRTSAGLIVAEATAVSEQGYFIVLAQEEPEIWHKPFQAVAYRMVVGTLTQASLFLSMLMCASAAFPSELSPKDRAMHAAIQGAVADLEHVTCHALEQAREAVLNMKRRRPSHAPAHVEGWRKVTHAVHAKGGLIVLQLWHMGRQSHSSHEAQGGAPVSASALAMDPAKSKVLAADGSKHAPEVPRALTLEEIPAVVESYRRAATYAKEAGFDGVEVHSANGYLLDQFLQSCSNQRTDAYGGSFENRARLLCEVLDAVLTVWPAGRVGVRLAPNGVYGSMGSPDNHAMFLYLARRLGSYRLAYLHLMDGLGFGFHNLCPPVTLHDFRREYGAENALVGNVECTRDMAEGAIRTGTVDAIAFGRAYIPNPDLVERFARDLPLAPDAPMSAWYDDEGPKGYTDWPTAAATGEDGGMGIGDGNGGKASL